MPMQLRMFGEEVVGSYVMGNGPGLKQIRVCCESGNGAVASPLRSATGSSV